MPAVTRPQYRAFQAAKHGHSTLGIPRRVGAEMVAATRNPGALPARRRSTKLRDVAHRMGKLKY